MVKQAKSKAEVSDGSNYLGAMRISVEMIDMCETYSELLQMLEHLNYILRGDKIAAIFLPSE